ncbi:MAG: hypothetical protein P8Y58_05005 [Novosphingobium sp.]
MIHAEGESGSVRLHAKPGHAAQDQVVAVLSDDAMEKAAATA